MLNISSLFRGAGAALLISALAACGGDSGTTEGGSGGDAKAVFEITGMDNMQYSTNKFETTVGKLTINFKNTGSQPITTMGHNLVVLKPGTDVVAWAGGLPAKGASAENNFLPESVRGDTMGFTKLLGPGESDSIVIDFKEPGEYPYVCTFTGHFGLMKGVITVK